MPLRALGVVLGALILGSVELHAQEGALDHLLRLEDGRSRRETSTRKLADARPDPDNNFDNFRVKPGEMHVLAELEGPGIIRHIWMTCLGPEPHSWAKEGAANHKDWREKRILY